MVRKESGGGLSSSGELLIVSNNARAPLNPPTSALEWYLSEKNDLHPTEWTF